MIDRSICILVLEDDRATSQEIMAVLGGSYQCNFVTSEEEAAALVSGSSFNLVVASLGLTEDSGKNLFGAIRKKSPDTHIIAMSEPDDIRCQAAAMRNGALYTVEKPIKPDRFLILIKSALRSYELIKNRAAGIDEQEYSTPASVGHSNRRVA